MESKPTLKKKVEKKLCSNWLKYGDCNHKEGCYYEHLDCEKFKETQKCNGTSCGYHRRMCNNWKNEGKCAKANCNYLHRTCDKDCDEKACPFYHSALNKNIDDILDGFKQKCLLCDAECILVYLSCGDNLYCEKCAKNLVKEGKCKHCSEAIRDYIRWTMLYLG